MKRTVIGLAFLAMSCAASAAAEDGNPKRGGQVYRACIACHALEPDLHLSGPSLASFLERQAGTAEGFVRYSPGLKEAGFAWNEAALDGWLKDPAGMIPDTYMVFRGIDDAQARADLIAFLEIAGAPGGGAKVVADGLIPASWLKSVAPDSVRDAPAGARIANIRHCGDSYFIKMQDGREQPYWEKNVRLKIDSAETGPPPGVAVVAGGGMQGDRIFVIFASLADLNSIVREGC